MMSVLEDLGGTLVDITTLTPDYVLLRTGFIKMANMREAAEVGKLGRFDG